MACDYPVYRKNKYYKEDGDELSHVPTPCGKCDACMKDKSRQWFVRLKYELKTATSAHFVTLTYANPPVSPNGHYTGSKSDLQKFFKRLRSYEVVKKNIGKPYKKKKGKRPVKCHNKELSYYAVLEYGKKYQRPHWHILFFNLRSIRSVYRAWAINDKPIGEIHDGKIENASINYVVGYVGKKIGIPTDDQDDRLKEQAFISKGLGISFLQTAGKFNKEYEEGYTIIDGVTYTLPRYYKNKLFPLYKARVTDQFGNEKVTTRQSAQGKRIGKKNLHRYIKAEEQKQKLYGSVAEYEKNKFDLTNIRNSNPNTIKTKFS